MKRRARRGLASVFIVLIVVVCGALAVGWLHDRWTRRSEPTPQRPIGTSGSADISSLRALNLRVPIDGSDVERWKRSFYEIHGGHRHEAVDILAPRDTPIHAVADGRVAKLFTSKAGGLTVYELDNSRRFIYYYAHLDHYAASLHNGDTVARGEVIGYVGTTGDAPPDTPHLHFAIFRVSDPTRWWEGTAIDPYEVYER
jgi:murein DD-endopeptidase MepM/ murein hydrolase activator NlpD